MVKVRKRGETVRQFILENIENNPKDIVQIASEKFGISRQAINKHIKVLVNQNAILMKGTTRSRFYTLSSNVIYQMLYDLDKIIEEDIVWRGDILPLLSLLPENVINIWHYCFTEMLNNVIDHSAGKRVFITVTKTAVTTKIVIHDDGEGIFKKIQRELNLLDERHAILELYKGKLTTDPSRHTGEGIFFTSRIVDDFDILSGNTFYSHESKDDSGWLVEQQKFQSGTIVFMSINNNSSRTAKEVFDKFTSDDDYGFTKTMVPVNLIRYGDELLVSRSQAKRLLARIEKFKTVILDFEGVRSIGQAFADEIFRVFTLRNKDITVLHINANKDVEQMIMHAILNK